MIHHLWDLSLLHIHGCSVCSFFFVSFYWANNVWSLCLVHIHGCSIYWFWKHLCIIKKHPWAGQRGWYGWQKRKHKKCTCNICLFIMCQYISWYMISIYVIHICKLKCKKIYWYICKSICSKNIYKHVDTLGYCFVYKLLRRVNWTIWNLKNCMIMNWNLIDLENLNFELQEMYHQL